MSGINPTELEQEERTALAKVLDTFGDVPAEDKDASSLPGFLQLLKDYKDGKGSYSTNKLKADRAADRARSLGKLALPRSAVTSPAKKEPEQPVLVNPDDSIISNIQQLISGDESSSVPLLRAQLQQKLQESERHPENKAVVTAYYDLLMLLAVVSPLATIPPPDQKKTAVATQTQAKKPDFFYISAGYRFSTKRSRADFTRFCQHKKISWLSSQDSALADQYLGQAAQTISAQMKLDEEMARQLQEQERRLPASDGVRAAIPQKTMQLIGDNQQRVGSAPQVSKADLDNQTQILADIHQQQNPHKASRSPYLDHKHTGLGSLQLETDPVGSARIGDEAKHQQHRASVPPGPGLIQSHSTSGVSLNKLDGREDDEGSETKSLSWGQRFVLALLILLALGCGGAVACAAIAWVTSAAFWIVPAALAVPVTIIAGIVLLLLLAALAYGLFLIKSARAEDSDSLLLLEGNVDSSLEKVLSTRPAAASLGSARQLEEGFRADPEATSTTLGHAP